MTVSDLPEDVVESIPEEVEITTISGENGGTIECEIDNLKYIFHRIEGGDDSECTIKVIDPDGEAIARSFNAPDWFWKTESGRSRCVNELLDDDMDELNEIRVESGIETLAYAFRELMDSDEVKIELRGFGDEIGEIEDIVKCIIPEKRDGEAVFRLRLDQEHRKTLSQKDPTAYISASAWASSNSNSFKTAFVEASAGGCEIDLPEDEPELVIDKIKGLLETDVEDQRPREERILDRLEEGLHRRVTAGSGSGGMSPRDDPTVGSDMFADRIDGETVVWIPKRLIIDELSDIISDDVISEMPDIERYGYQRGLIVDESQKIKPNGSIIRCYPISTSEIDREKEAEAVLSTPDEDDEDEGGDS
jgi:hypothetical protein